MIESYEVASQLFTHLKTKNAQILHFIIEISNYK